MILCGSSRGGASNLAAHLLKHENEHIEIHSIEGFASQNLHGALNEAYAMSRGTKCRLFLFSLSLNPPPNEKVETSVFETAIGNAEEKLGLTGQPRAIVFHEKNGRRHAHAVWSRIDPENMKAIQMSYSNLKLRELSRSLFIEHGWKLPRGYVNSKERSMTNFTLAEWQQAKRIGTDPREIKAAFQDAWAISDSKSAFIHALEERGYKIARGDKRGFVAIDVHGEVYSIPRQAGVKTKAVRERLGDEKELLSVAQVKAQTASEMIPALGRMKQEQGREYQARKADFEDKRQELVQTHKHERASLSARNEQQHAHALQRRQARFRSGIRGIWDRLTGEHKRIQKQNELEAHEALVKQRQEKDQLIFKQLEQRQHLQRLLSEQREKFIVQRRELRRDIQRFKSELPKSHKQTRDDFIRERQQQSQKPRPRIRGPDRTPRR